MVSRWGVSSASLLRPPHFYFVFFKFQLFIYKMDWRWWRRSFFKLLRQEDGLLRWSSPTLFQLMKKTLLILLSYNFQSFLFIYRQNIGELGKQKKMTICLQPTRGRRITFSLFFVICNFVSLYWSASIWAPRDAQTLGGWAAGPTGGLACTDCERMRLLDLLGGPGDLAQW